MLLSHVDLDRLQNTDLLPYLALESRLADQFRTPDIRPGHLSWPLEHPLVDGHIVHFSLDYRGWFYLTCVNLFCEWVDAEPGRRETAIARYATLGEWMAKEIYCVFPDRQGPDACPAPQRYASWIRGRLGSALAGELFGAQADVWMPSPGAYVFASGHTWEAMVTTLMAIVGSVSTQEAITHRPAIELQDPCPLSQADVRIRRDAQAWARRILPEWIGQTVPADEEERVLRTIDRALKLTDCSEVEALAFHGVALTLTLSPSAWARARAMFLREFRVRCAQGSKVLLDHDHVFPTLIAYVPDVLPEVCAGEVEGIAG